MRRLIMLCLALITSQAFAQVIKLSPNESKSLTNHAPWTLSATCNVQSSQANSKILVSVTENKGTVNGKSLSKGQTTSIKLKTHANISVSAEPGTTVNLVNSGAGEVEAVCYT